MFCCVVDGVRELCSQGLCEHAPVDELVEAVPTCELSNGQRRARQGTRRNQVRPARRVARIDYDRQVRKPLHDRDRRHVVQVAGRLVEPLHTPFAQHDVWIAL